MSIIPFHRFSLLFSAVALVWCGTVHAQAPQAPHGSPSSLPSVDEIVQKLAPTTSPPVKKRRTRGLVVEEDPSEGSAQNASNLSNSNNNHTDQPPVEAKYATAPINQAVAQSPKKYSESRITFEVGSDRLTPYAKRVLDIFGTAIQSPQLANAQFVIEGHTDGTGSDQYNLDLSKRRAESVIRYLVHTSGIDPTRLAAKGKGRRELVNHDDPASSENRRVVWLSQQ